MSDHIADDGKKIPAEPQGEPVGYVYREHGELKGAITKTNTAIGAPLFVIPDPRIAALEGALKVAQDTIEHAERWATHKNDKQFFQSAKERIEAALGGP